MKPCNVLASVMANSDMSLTVQRIIIAALALILAGCAAFRPQGGQEHLQDRLSQLDHWQVRGKMSVRTPDDGATGYLDWQQNDREFDIYIAGPLGQGATRLSGDKASAQLTLPGWDEPRSADSPEELMLLYMGWNFPVSDIRYWVKGQPSPRGDAETQYDDTGLLSQMNQYGWEIRYSRYSQQNGYWVPGLVKVSGYDFRFTFSIREWTLYD